MTDCGHLCCDERAYPYHDHFLAAADCPRCRTIAEHVDRIERVPGSDKENDG